MQSPVNLIPSALGELFAEVNHNGYITLADRYGSMAASFDDSLNDDDRSAANRMLRSVIKGRVKIANEISTAA